MPERQDDHASGDWVVNGPNIRGRKCGSCTLCCFLLPVNSLGKGGGVRCQHQRSTGCSIYAQRPFECRTFSCRWLIDESTSELRRPDKVGYVIDPMPDTILANGQPIDVVQIWVSRPDAHRDEALRRWLDEIGRRHGIPALIRESPQNGWLLVPPSMSEGGEWLELDSQRGDAETMDKLRADALGRYFGEGGA